MVLFKLHIFALNLVLFYPQIEIDVFLQKKQTIYLVHPCCVCVCVRPTLSGGFVVAGVEGGG